MMMIIMLMVTLLPCRQKISSVKDMPLYCLCCPNRQSQSQAFLLNSCLNLHCQGQACLVVVLSMSSVSRSSLLLPCVLKRSNHCVIWCMNLYGCETNGKNNKKKLLVLWNRKLRQKKLRQMLHRKDIWHLVRHWQHICPFVKLDIMNIRYRMYGWSTCSDTWWCWSWLMMKIITNDVDDDNVDDDDHIRYHHQHHHHPYQHI